jgi:RNA polymerase sigma factor (sigma-70 family)
MHLCDVAVMSGFAAQDTERVAAVVAGDEDAFAEIVHAYHEDMRRVCVVVVGDDDLAAQAVEAAWAIAWRRLPSLRDPARLRPWLVSVAVNEARQLLRARKRRALVEMNMAAASGRVGNADPATAIDEIDLRNALARLDPADRALLAMRYLIGFDSTELALATGRSPSGVRARIGRLLKRLHMDLANE